MFYTEQSNPTCRVCGGQKASVVEVDNGGMEKSVFISPGLFYPMPNQRVISFYCSICGIKYEVPGG